jgi:hypothetical protein
MAVVKLNKEQILKHKKHMNVTFMVAVTGKGVVTKKPDQSTYDVGDKITLTATAAAGWKFSHWSGDVEESRADVPIITVGASDSIGVVFVVAGAITSTASTPLARPANPRQYVAPQYDDEGNVAEGTVVPPGHTVPTGDYVLYVPAGSVVAKDQVVQAESGGATIAPGQVVPAGAHVTPVKPGTVVLPGQVVVSSGPQLKAKLEGKAQADPAYRPRPVTEPLPGVPEEATMKLGKTVTGDYVPGTGRYVAYVPQGTTVAAGQVVTSMPPGQIISPGEAVPAGTFVTPIANGALIAPGQVVVEVEAPNRWSW